MGSELPAAPVPPGTRWSTRVRPSDGHTYVGRGCRRSRTVYAGGRWSSRVSGGGAAVATPAAGAGMRSDRATGAAGPHTLADRLSPRYAGARIRSSNSRCVSSFDNPIRSDTPHIYTELLSSNKSMPERRIYLAWGEFTSVVPWALRSRWRDSATVGHSWRPEIVASPWSHPHWAFPSRPFRSQAAGPHGHQPPPSLSWPSTR